MAYLIKARLFIVAFGAVALAVVIIWPLWYSDMPPSATADKVTTIAPEWQTGKKNGVIKLIVQNDSSRTVVSSKVKIEVLDALYPDGKVVQMVEKTFKGRVLPGQSKQYEVLLAASPHAVRCRSNVEKVQFEGEKPL